MMWYKETAEEKYARKKRWHKVFAWFPVKCEKFEPFKTMTGGLFKYHCHVWLQSVYKSSEYSVHGVWSHRYCISNPDFLSESDPVAGPKLKKKVYSSIEKIRRHYGIEK